MTTNREVYEAAKKHLGHHGAHARAYCRLGSGQPYCCAFVTMCFHDAKADKLFYGGKKVTYCPAAIQWCRANLAQIPSYLAMRMDLIFFDWAKNGQDGSPDHVGIVERVENGIVYTVEGNSGDACRENSYAVGYFEILGYASPAYGSDQSE